MRVLKRAREKIGEGGMEEGQKERVRREASVKERGKKARKKRDDVLPGPRATYGALAARLLITRPSRSLFSLPFSFPLFLSVPSRSHPTAKVSSPAWTLYAEFSGVSRILPRFRSGESAAAL